MNENVNVNELCINRYINFFFNLIFHLHNLLETFFFFHSI